MMKRSVVCAAMVAIASIGASTWTMLLRESARDDRPRLVASGPGIAPLHDAVEPQPPTSGRDPLITCRGESLSVAALARRRGVTSDDLPGLLKMGFTADTFCNARDAIINEGVEMLERPKPTHPGEYLRWRNLSLQDENGQIDPDGLMRAKAHVDLMRESQGDNPSGAGIGRGSWSSLGPGNIGGRIRALVIHPTSTDTMFIGSASGGIWKTTNGGTTWTVVADFMANLAVSTIVMQPGAPSTMYAGTGEGFFNADNIRGVGIFKSTDGGTTWTQLASTSTAPSAGLSAVDFRYVNRLAMSADGLVLLAATRSGVYRSIDAGASFTRTTLVGGGALPVSLSMADVDFHPTDSQRAIASNYGTQVYVSADGGNTWTASTGLPASITADFERVEIAYAPSAPLTVYASIDVDGGSLYRSLDGGLTFTEVFDGASDTTLNPLQTQGWYDNLLWVSPTDPNLVIWGGVDNFRSTNGGVSFQKISQWFSHSFSNPTSAHADQHIAVAHPGFNGTTNRTVFFGNDGGIYRADDITTVGGGASPFQAGWSELNNGLAITQFYGAAGHPPTGRITGGTQDNGTLFFNPAIADPTENWSAPFGGDGGHSAYDSVDPNVFYGEYVYLQVHRNNSGGASSSAYIFSGLTDAGNPNTAEFISPFIKDPNENNRLLGGGVRLWRTNNAKAAAPTWESIKDTLGGATPQHITAIAVEPGNADTIYVGHDNGKLFKTTTGTSAAATVLASWITLDDNATTNPIPAARRITRITIDPSNPNIVYVAMGGFSDVNLWKSTNGGVTWTDITGPAGGATALPDAPVRDIEVHPSNSNFLYAGTEVGIFTSEDGGLTWTVPHDGPANVSVDELFFMGPTLHAVTHGRGVFRTATTSAMPVAVDDAYAVTPNTALTVSASGGVLANDNANGGGTMTAALVTTVSNGSLTLNADGSFVYTPNSGFAGADSFTYRAVTIVGSGNVATVTLSTLPSAVNDSYGVTFNAALSVPVASGVLANDSANGGGTMTASLVTTVSNGSLTLNTDGSFGYTPNTGFTGTDSFTYRAATSVGNGNVATVTLSVLATAVDDAYTLGSNTTLTVPAATGVLANDNARGGGAMTAALVASVSNGSLTLNGDGSFSYTPATNFEGTDSFTYRAVTSAGASNIATVGLTIVPRVGVPQGLTAEVSGNTVTLRWTPGVGALTTDGYDILAGVSPTSTAPVLALGNVTSVTVGSAPDGIFHVRVRARAGSVIGAASASIEVRIGSAALPGAATNLLVGTNGSTVSLAWIPSDVGGTISHYEVRGALSAGAPPIATLVVPPGSTLLSIPGVPGGTYFIRIVAVGPAGTAAPSNEVMVTVPGACTVPQPVQNFRRIGTGSSVVLRWDLASSGSAPTQFVVQAGFGPGLSNAAVVTTPGLGLQATAPPGTYHVRVIAQNSCGSSAATGDLVITVP